MEGEMTRGMKEAMKENEKNKRRKGCRRKKDGEKREGGMEGKLKK